MMPSAAKPSKAVNSRGARPTLNPWIVVGLVLVLLIAFILIERYIRHSIEGPGHLRQEITFVDRPCHSTLAG